MILTAMNFNNPKSSNFLKAEALASNTKRKIILAIVLTAVLFGMGLIFLFLAVRVNHTEAALINMSGYQRMLAQRVDMLTNKIILVKDKSQRKQFREELLKAADLMESFHLMLINGNPEIGLRGVPSPVIRTMYFQGPHFVDKRVRAFVAAAREVANLPDEKLHYDNPFVRKIVNEGQEQSLVAVLNAIVEQYQKESEEKISSLEILVAGIFLLIFLALILEWRYILSPMSRHIREEAHRLVLSEKKILDITSSLREGILVADKEGRAVFMNLEAERLTGWKKEELTEGTVFSLLHFESADSEVSAARENTIKNVIETGKTQRLSHCLLKQKDGKTISLAVTASVILEDGEVTGVVTALHDITELKFIEKKLKKYQEGLVKLSGYKSSTERPLSDYTTTVSVYLEIQRVSIWILENSGARLRCLNLFDSDTKKNSSGMEVTSSDYPGYFKAMNKENSIVIDDVSTDPRTLELMEPYFKPNGITSMLDIPIKVGEKKVGVLCHEHVGHIRKWTDYEKSFAIAAGDILSLRFEQMERKKTEQELRTLSNAMEQSGESVLITDSEGSIKYANPSTTKMTLYSQEELIGKNPRVLKSGRQDDSFYKNLWKTIIQGKIWSGRIVNRKKNGELYTEEMTISPVKNDNGEITNFVAIKHDVTQQIKSEEKLREAHTAAEEANKSKSEFLANMSHEIRTPMNAVIGMSYLALKTELTPRQRDYVEKIQSSAQSLLGIINEILDFSKIEAGKLEMEFVNFHLDDVLNHLASTIGSKGEEKNLELLFSTSKEVHPCLIGDPLRLRQILTNLVSNAIKFTESGEVLLSTELLKEEEDRVMLRFSIKDTGIGVTAEQAASLFKSFSQADASITRKYGGTGLGLIICKRFVEKMGGKIQMKSELGKGSVFSFTAWFGRGTKERRKYRLSSAELKGTRVLVVDDNVSSREVFKQALESFCFKVTSVPSGEEALTTLKEACPGNPFDLALLDYAVPDMDGIETVRRINTDPNIFPKPRVIMFTTYAMDEVRRMAEEVKPDGFLTKPVTMSTLFTAVMNAFGKKGGKIIRPSEKMAVDLEALKEITGARILLVEDNEVNRQVTMELLYLLGGLIVSIAENGKEAVEMVKKEEFDGVLMDVQMPVMDGLTATREIRNWEQEKQKSEDEDDKSETADFKSQISNQKSKIRIPIIAMTAYAMKHDVEKCLEAGMDDHVAKPVEIREFYKKLCKWIKPPRSRTKSLVLPPMTLKSEDRKEAEREHAIKGKIDRDILAPLFKKLNSFLEDCDPDAWEPIEAIKERLKETIYEVQVRKLEKYMREYDFDEMLRVLAELEKATECGGGQYKKVT